MDAQGGSAPLTAEQIRDAVSRLVQGVNAGGPGELARELFRDDGEFSEALIESVPRLVSAAAQAVKAFVESLEGMPADRSAELLAGSYAGVDGGEIGEALNALSRLVIRLHEENPQLFTSGRSGIASDIMQAVDFGKLRKAITYRGGERLDALRAEVELLGENPVALVNIFSVVAPLINDAVRVLKSVFEILALPPEAMAYALFKILEDIEWREFASVLNGAAAFVVALHRGSYILGDGSLYSRGSFGRIGSELAAGLDGKVLAEALAAAGEQGEALLSSVSGQVLTDESLVVPLAEASVSLANSFFRTAVSILENAASLPSDSIRGIAGAIDGGLEAAELARALSLLAALGRRIGEESPGLAERLSRETLSGLGVDLGPEAVAAGLNRALSSYNAATAGNPGMVERYMDGLLAAIDVRELEIAARTGGDQVAGALSRNPEVVRTVVRALFSIAFGGARAYVKSLRGRLGRRKG